MFITRIRNIKRRGLAAFLAAIVFLLPACGGPKPTPTATPPVPVDDGSFDNGRGLQISFKLLYALDSFGKNSVLGTTGLAEVLAAVKDGAAGETDAALARELGMQEMLPRQINEVALHMRQSLGKITKGEIIETWGLFVPEGLYVKESYNYDCRQSFQMNPDFKVKYPFDGEVINKYLGEWVDSSTSGLMKSVNFTMPQANGPFFADILSADPDWQTAMETGKSRPLPFTYESGEEKAVPTMVCLQNCGIFQSSAGSIAILPTAGDEARLVLMKPPEGMSLHDFIPVAAALHDEWMDKAQWGAQRVLLPRFSLSFNGSVMPVLDRAGLASLLARDADYSGLGEGLFFSDILHEAKLTVDETGMDPPDPNAPSYRRNIKDDIPTMALDGPFIVALETPGGNGSGGQVLMMGVVHDPLQEAGN